MTNRENVIKALECRKNAHKRCGNPCERTGYCAYATWIRDPDGEPYYPCYCDVERLCDDAIALLEEQEPVAPVEEWAWYDCYKCGACSKLWGKTYEIERWNFCPWCGKAVKWDG